MKTLLAVIIIGVVAHAAVGVLMNSTTAKSLQDHKVQLELAAKGI